MSDRFEQRFRRTFAEHRKAVGLERDVRGSTQAVLNVLADAITDLNAAVAKLLEAEMKRYKRKLADGSSQATPKDESER